MVSRRFTANDAEERARRIGAFPRRRGGAVAIVGQYAKWPTKLLRQFGSSQLASSPSPLNWWPRV